MSIHYTWKEIYKANTLHTRDIKDQYTILDKKYTTPIHYTRQEIYNTNAIYMAGLIQHGRKYIIY